MFQNLSTLHRRKKGFLKISVFDPLFTERIQNTFNNQQTLFRTLYYNVGSNSLYSSLSTGKIQEKEKEKEKEKEREKETEKDKFGNKSSTEEGNRSITDIQSTARGIEGWVSTLPPFD